MELGDMDEIKQIYAGLLEAFHQLGLNSSPEVLEPLAQMIYQAMSSEGRYYHTPDHAISLMDGLNPVQRLAALFHDVVYHQVDGGFSAEVWAVLKSYLVIPQTSRAGFMIASGIHPSDLGFHLVADIFGYKPGQRLFTHSGSNEFLSSLVMVIKIGELIPVEILVQCIACIEATIPFRGQDADGNGPFDRLASRLKKTIVKHRIPMGQQEIDQAIQQAVLFANRDIANFTEPNPGVFIENTWKLLPEFSPALRKGSNYSVQAYRQALQAMRKFLSSIEPENVQHEYKGVPSRAERQDMLAQIKRNLSVSGEYLEVKLLTAAVLEALAKESGGDAPISIFIGDLNKDEDEEPGLGRLLPDEPLNAQGIDCNSSILELLLAGRQTSVDFTDTRTTPLAAYIYICSGAVRTREYLARAEQMFAGKIRPVEFLQALDEAMTATIIHAIAKQVPSRQAVLISLGGIIQNVRSTNG